MIEERIFNNRYRLDGKLGEGGMAIVYSGTDTVLRRRVAIKVLREQYAADQEFVRRFYQEAESAAKLSHPNIVNTYDVGREGATYYIVMELVDGPSLGEIIAADGKLPEPVAIDYAAQIASGLAYAHRSGLLHRDIKPANILVTKDDVVKLSDFGIARAVSQNTIAMTKPGLVMGSVFYMSPEQAQLNELHETSDLYSVGIVLFQMLAGKLPFTGESPVTVALRHISDPVPRIDTREIGVSPALAAIVNRLLQKRPENRFQSASELATSLREARERPNVPAFRMQDDAPELALEAAKRRERLPRRQTPLPDHRRYAVDEEEERPPRRYGLIAVLAVFLIAAIGAGYYVFGRPLPSLSPTVPVADYTKMTDAQANAAIVNAGLRVHITRSASDTVPANRVISQDPLPGANVDKNSLVDIVVSNGLPNVGLPSVLGYNFVEAERTLQAWPNAKFLVDIKRSFNEGPKDSVIDQQPKPGAQVREGSKITLTVSDGPAPTFVPNFVGMTTAAAQAAAAKAGIKLDTSQTISGMPANTIASQDATPGSKIDANVVVHVIVNSGGGVIIPATGAASTATVPALVGQDYASAAAALTTAGFTPRVVYAQQSTNNGSIVLQDPPANAAAATGSTVTVTVSVSGEVPDTVGMTADAATRRLATYGYSVAKIEYTTAVGAGGKVVGTVPEAGTDLAPGSSVTLTVNGTGH
jgi:eukaryotic-like serine/threonine-protein kinase